MADQSFPQIPSTVWWGVRQLLQRTPKAKFDDNMLAASLSVQPAASRQYIAELKRVGILDEDGKATELANKWRMDDSYADAVAEIASGAYPDSLTTIAPPGDADRQKVVNWFMTQGLGEGSAKNKAATYLLLTSGEPNAPPPSNARAEQARSSGDRKSGKTTRTAPTTNERASVATANKKRMEADIMPLNVNVQIHISADASNDQIETIFASMRKYLRND